ncbi:Acetyltransferase (GNAT) domain-containing protein [Paenibacillus sophorae]|uniref:Acetyltransferase (GNAT) domain-containing protein n=1 Tax=Paenibacillus sophorae TaxID=1333845 RepID=A0A1H8K2N5_9BACL|nr:GNAT family N-acetyltransferase [Paenibacillus sophorae]QWU13577.1 GNAT family N-acetyltransferase [Paenibacillus sophorae]SEN87095.1 Acetyltransferase (GNAT) domain-containing protein [Paenibacillus sophorae]
MNNLAIKTCSETDLELLAELNRQLIEDEKHDNKMDTVQLKERMKNFLDGDYQAYLFLEDDDVKGYALVHHGSSPLYVRHFFICRHCRRQGYGLAAFRKLSGFLDTDRLDIEVMYWNERAYAFWKSLGFRERSVYMRLEP